MQVGNDFFREAMASIPGHLSPLSVAEWRPTPFMLDVCVKDREDQIMHWLRTHYGPESSPMHGREGVWKRASVTLENYSWFGFKTEALLARFVARLLTRFQ